MFSLREQAGEVGVVTPAVLQSLLPRLHLLNQDQLLLLAEYMFLSLHALSYHLPCHTMTQFSLRPSFG
jgi:hypothetical protein